MQIPTRVAVRAEGIHIRAFMIRRRLGEIMQSNSHIGEACIGIFLR